MLIVSSIGTLVKRLSTSKDAKIYIHEQDILTKYIVFFAYIHGDHGNHCAHVGTFRLFFQLFLASNCPAESFCIELATAKSPCSEVCQMVPG